jgi:hypothetical protein
MPLAFLTKQEIEAAIARLSELAAAEGVRLEMTLYGGALMLLAYEARDVTKDVDAIVHPPGVARRLVAKVAAERGLHENWLNDDVKQFISTRERKNDFPTPNVNRAGLHLTRPTAKYLLAMKVMACRKPLPGYRGDIDDIEMLLRITKAKTVEQVQHVVDAFFPDIVLPDPVQLTLTELLAKIHEDNPAPPPQPATDRARHRTSR